MNDWRALERLREVFLGQRPSSGNYWESDELLDAYDRTFGRRIRWKWDAVLHELVARGFRARADDVYDWGCGSGVAYEALRAHVEGVESLGSRHWDRSPRARRFAARKAPAPLPDPPSFQGREPEWGARSLVLISHVLSELPDDVLGRLITKLGFAGQIIWVEAGSSAESRKLSSIRNRLLATGQFRLLGPCTHAHPCPLLKDGNERHWCHQFATPPTDAFTSPEWSEISKRFKIDLRSLPYSYLALERTDRPEPQLSTWIAADRRGPAGEWSRILGEVRESKGFLRLQSCDPDGEVRDLILQKRDAPELFRALGKGVLKATEGIPVYRWTTENGKITGYGENDG